MYISEKLGTFQCISVHYCVMVVYYFSLTGVINYITTPKRHQCVCNSTTAVLNCGVMATPPARIAWMKNGLPISKANHHYLILSSHDHSNYSSVLLVYDTSPDDNGWYTCVVSNSAVSDRTSGYLRVSPRCGKYYTRYTCLTTDFHLISEKCVYVCMYV